MCGSAASDGGATISLAYEGNNGVVRQVNSATYSFAIAPDSDYCRATIALGGSGSAVTAYGKLE